jgi:ankyrin repeat protein
MPYRMLRGIALTIRLGGFLGLAGVRAANQDTRVLTAVARGDLDAVRALLKQKADVNVREADGSTPLLWAVHQTNAGLVTLLIDAGADVNAANRYGITPLVEASRLGSTPIIDALLKAGANPNAAPTSSARSSAPAPIRTSSRRHPSFRARSAATRAAACGPIMPAVG